MSQGYKRCKKTTTARRLTGTEINIGDKAYIDRLQRAASCPLQQKRLLERSISDSCEIRADNISQEKFSSTQSSLMKTAYYPELGLS